MKEIEWETRYSPDGIKFDKQGRFARIASYNGMRIGWIDGTILEEDNELLKAKVNDKVYICKTYFPSIYNDPASLITTDLTKAEMFIELEWYKFLRRL